MMARRSARLSDLLQRHALAAAAMLTGVIVSVYLLPLPQGAFAALLAALAILIAVIDLEYRIIPDAANALMFGAGLVLVVLEAFPGQLLWDLGDALLRSAVAGGVLLALRYFYGRRSGIEGLGLGDAKLAAAGRPLSGHAASSPVIFVTNDRCDRTRHPHELRAGHLQRAGA